MLHLSYNIQRTQFILKNLKQKHARIEIVNHRLQAYTYVTTLSFSYAVAIDKCLNAPQNVVVYEGTENIILSCGLGPSAEGWTVRSTSLAARQSQITNFTDSVSPDVMELYAINQSGLIIRNATINPPSTAGLYYMYFEDGSNTGAKVVVIRK